MKVIVCSDSHGAFAAAEQLLEQQPKAAAVIFLGDGAEEWCDLHEIYPEIPFYPVRGNCDWGSDWPGERIVELGGHRIFCTHGHLYGVKTAGTALLEKRAAEENHRRRFPVLFQQPFGRGKRPVAVGAYNDLHRGGTTCPSDAYR